MRIVRQWKQCHKCTDELLHLRVTMSSLFARWLTCAISVERQWEHFISVHNRISGEWHCCSHNFCYRCYSDSNQQFVSFHNANKMKCDFCVFGRELLKISTNRQHSLLLLGHFKLAYLTSNNIKTKMENKYRKIECFSSARFQRCAHTKIHEELNFAKIINKNDAPE